MPSQYEAYKVQDLINQYRANPDMFNEDQLDQLERIAADNLIEFKRKQSPFSLRRAFQQATAGFVEGLTTLDLIPKEPRNTGEAIFRQLGHLAGFAPGIMKAPIYGLAKITSKFTGKEMKDVLGGTITKATLSGIERLDAIAIPMIASRGTKKLIDRQLKKTGLESRDYLARGAKTRAIAEEALGLASASAVSSVWKGTDAIIDSYIGGAIAGGAFGGIGNFVSLGNLYKGTPQQVERAEKILRTGLGAMVTGLPATLRNEPTEMQIYEYLLGGFFGYNTRPAHKAAAQEWIVKPERKQSEFLDPESSKDFKNYNKNTREYILNEHEGSIKPNSENLQGSSGMSLSYLEQGFPNVNWRQRAEAHLSKHKKDPYTQQDINRFYRNEAGRLHYEKSTQQFIEAIIRENAIANPQNDDFHDPVVIRRDKVVNLAKGFYEKADKKLYPDVGLFAEAMEGARDKSIVRGKPDPELFIREIKKVVGEDQVNSKTEAKLRSFFLKDVEPLQEVLVLRLTPDNDFHVSIEKMKGQEVQNVSIGERYNELPINQLGEGFQFLTHAIDRFGNPLKILSHRIVDKDIEFNIKPNQVGLMQDALAEQGKYIYSGVKDKDMLMVASFKDEYGGITVTKDNLIDLLSKGNYRTRKAIEESYRLSLEAEKEVFNNTDLHERKWVSNIMHDAINNGLVKGGNLEGISNLLTSGFGKSVADVNKRMQLLANRMTPMSASSFAQTNPDGKMRVIIVPDINTTGISDTDGGMIYRQKFFDAGLHGVGLDPQAGHFKPVIVGRTSAGTLATKSNGQRATEVWNRFMEKHGVDAIMFDSSAKLRGLHENSNIRYEKSWLTAKDGSKTPQFELFPEQLKVYELPIESLQISLGTFEKPFKQVMGDEIPIQFYGQANADQAKGFKELYFKEAVEKSILGSSRGQNLVDAYNKAVEGKKGKAKDAEMDAFVKLFNDHDLGVMELPLDFVVEYLATNKDPKLTSLFMNKINKLDKDGFFDRDFEFDANADYAKFHDQRKVISESMRDHFMTRNALFNSNWHNALKKYLVRRFSNPFIETGGKSWLKAYTPDQMSYVEIDPWLIKHKGDKARELREGEIYLDESFRKMPVVFRDKQLTLGELWKLYRREYTKGISTKAMGEFNDALTLLAIRIPADSMSGTRSLRFRGFTGQRGAGSFTHDKDNFYLGGADKDSDSIKIFQGFSKKLRKYFENVKDERAHLESNKPYSEFLDGKFTEVTNPEMLKRYRGVKEFLDREQKTKRNPDFEHYNAFKYSPAYRYKAAQNSTRGKSGLGYGLSSAVVMRQWVDYVKAKDGAYSFDFYHPERNKEYLVDITLKEEMIHGIPNEQYFRDLIFKIVNKSADASNDPTVIPYNKFRDLLFDSMLDVNVYEKGSGKLASSGEFKYQDILDWGPSSALGLLREAVNVSKPLSKVRSIASKRLKPLLEEKIVKGKKVTILKKTGNKLIADLKWNDYIGLSRGESANIYLEGKQVSITNITGATPNKLVYKINEFPKDSMSLFDVVFTNSRVAAKALGDKAFNTSVIPLLPLRMEKAGINFEKFQFSDINKAYKKLYTTLDVKLLTPSEGIKGKDFKGKLVSYSKKEIQKFVNDHLGILTEDMLISSSGAIGNLRLNREMGYALDLTSRTFGQFAAIELANKHFLDIHQAMANKGVKGNITKEFIPQIFEMNKRLKEMIRSKEDDIEIDILIEKGNQKIMDLADKYGIDPNPMMKYFHTILLSPITGLKQKGGKNFPLVRHDEKVHGSKSIDPMTRREYYSRMEDLYNRSKVPDKAVELDVKVDVKVPMDVFEPKATLDAFKEIDHVIKSDALDLMAINKPQVKEIKKFKKFLKDHPFLADNFNEWFKFFTGELSGRGIPRSATDFKMEDVVAINRFMEQFHDPKNLEFKLKYWHLDPRFVDSEMAMKGIINKYKAYHAPVKHGSGKIKNEPVYRFMSPIGAISQYVLKSERGISKDRNASEKVFKPISDILSKYTIDQGHSMFDKLITARESGNKENLSPVLKKLDAEVTKFFRDMGEKWIYTYDSKMNRVSDKLGNWELDNDFDAWYKNTRGKMNKHMRWNKDGIFDFKHFRDTVVDKDMTRPDLIKTVGIDGLKRYEYEKRLMEILKARLEKTPDMNVGKFIKGYRSGKNKFSGIGQRNAEEYIPHLNFGYNDAAQRDFIKSIQVEADRVENRVFKETKSVKQAEKAKELFIRRMERKAQFSTEFFGIKDLIDTQKITDAELDAKLEQMGFDSKISVLEARELDLKGYDRRPNLIADYHSKLINGWYKNLVAIKGDYEISNMKHRMRNYKTSKVEKKKFKNSKRYNNYIDVWSDYVKLYMQSALGHQSYFPQEIMTEIERGIDPLYLKDKRNLFYLTSDQNMIKAYEKLWQSKKWKKVPFIGKTLRDAPKDKEARKEYFSRKIHDFGRMEAQYELMTLLANTGTWATNIFSGNLMTLGSAGVRNFKNAFNNEKIYSRLLSNEKGKPVLKLFDGSSVKNKKDLHEWLKERGVIDNFIQNEFEYNEGLKNSLKKAGVNISDFKRDISKAIKSHPKVREESIGQVIERYGVKDAMLKYGSFFMQHSERVNRLNAFIAHGLQAVEKFGPEGRNLSIADDFVFEMAMKGIENTQFLYQNALRPAFMRTATGKVLSRFKLFVWNSVRVRKEFYNQAKLYGFRSGTPEYERFKDMFMIDMFMMALGSAFMFSIFDTALAPPYDWIQAMADWTYGDKRERDMAFFGSKLGPANLLKPPIARIPESMIELMTGDWEKFADYSVYTMFPFGRAVRQAKQIYERPERVGEVLLRLPVNKVQSRIDRAKRRGQQMEEIEQFLGEA